MRAVHSGRGVYHPLLIFGWLYVGAAADDRNALVINGGCNTGWHPASTSTLYGFLLLILGPLYIMIEWIGLCAAHVAKTGAAHVSFRFHHGCKRGRFEVRLLDCKCVFILSHQVGKEIGDVVYCMRWRGQEDGVGDPLTVRQLINMPFTFRIPRLPSLNSTSVTHCY